VNQRGQGLLSLARRARWADIVRMLRTTRPSEPPSSPCCLTVRTSMDPADDSRHTGTQALQRSNVSALRATPPDGRRPTRAAGRGPARAAARLALAPSAARCRRRSQRRPGTALKEAPSMDKSEPDPQAQAAPSSELPHTAPPRPSRHRPCPTSTPSPARQRRGGGTHLHRGRVRGLSPCCGGPTRSDGSVRASSGCSSPTRQSPRSLAGGSRTPQPPWPGRRQAR
jgi:hypothetical protein